jgi:hypothetical protein
MKNDIMHLDVKIGYDDILKAEKILDSQSIGSLKGIHYKLHKLYNLKVTRREIKILIYKAHNLLIKRFEKYELDHKVIDNLDIQLKRKPIEKKQPEIKKRQVFLLRKAIRKNG